MDRGIDVIKYQIKEILNKYPNSLEIKVNKNELSVSLDYKYHDAWNKYVQTMYEWYVINIELDKKFKSIYLKRLLQAKQFLKINYK